MLTREDETVREQRDQALDAALEQTFPASDPIALSVPTREPRESRTEGGGSNNLPIKGSKMANR